MTPTETLRDIPVAALTPSPNNPRETFDTAEMAELVEDVRQHGILQPLMVRPLAEIARWEIVFGHRRLRAAQAAGLAVVPCVVRELDATAALELTIAENLQREDLSAVEEARGFKKLREARGWTQQQLAEHIGKSQSHVANRERLLALPADVQQRIISRAITPAAATVLAALKPAQGAMVWVERTDGATEWIESPDDLWKLAEQGMSSHELERAAQRWQREVQRQEDSAAADERAHEAVKAEVAKLEKKYPGRPVATYYDRYAGYGAGPTTKTMFQQVNTSGDSAWNKSDVCTDCKKCERTGFLVQIAGAKPHVWVRCVDQACNDQTKDRIRKAKAAKEKAAGADDAAIVERIIALPIGPDVALQTLRDALGYAAIHPELAENLQQLAARVLARHYERCWNHKDKKAFLEELGLASADPKHCKTCNGHAKEEDFIAGVCASCYEKRWRDIARADVRAGSADAIQIKSGRPITDADVPHVTTIIWNAYREAMPEGATLDKVNVAGSNPPNLGVHWHRGDGKLREPAAAKGKMRVVETMPDFPDQVPEAVAVPA